MLAKTVLLVCAQALLVQTAFSACAGSRTSCGGCGGCGGCGAGAAGYGAGLAGYGAGAGCGAGVASTGGGLVVSSVSPIAPVGISVISENAYEGQLCAGGNLPFLGGVAIDGVLATDGAGAVSYGCGDGAVAIGNEAPIGTGILSGQSYAPSAGLISQNIGAAGYGRGAGYGLAGAGYGLGGGCGCAGAGIARRGCGCSGRY